MVEGMNAVTAIALALLLAACSPTEAALAPEPSVDCLPFERTARVLTSRHHGFDTQEEQRRAVRETLVALEEHPECFDANERVSLLAQARDLVRRYEEAGL